MGTCTGDAEGRGSRDGLREVVVGGLRAGVAGGAGADPGEVLQPFQPLPAEHQPGEQSAFLPMYP